MFTDDVIVTMIQYLWFSWLLFIADYSMMRPMYDSLWWYTMWCITHLNHFIHLLIQTYKVYYTCIVICIHMIIWMCVLYSDIQWYMHIWNSMNLKQHSQGTTTHTHINKEQCFKLFKQVQLFFLFCFFSSHFFLIFLN